MWDWRWASWRARARSVAVVSVGEGVAISVYGAGGRDWVAETGRRGCAVEDVRRERNVLANILFYSIILL